MREHIAKTLHGDAGLAEIVTAVVLFLLVLMLAGHRVVVQ